MADDKEDMWPMETLYPQRFSSGTSRGRKLKGTDQLQLRWENDRYDGRRLSVRCTMFFVCIWCSVCHVLLVKCDCTSFCAVNETVVCYVVVCVLFDNFFLWELL